MAQRRARADFSGDHISSDFIFRVVVLGDDGVGKSSLVQAFAGECAMSAYGESAGYYCRQVTLNADIKVNLQMKDLHFFDRIQLSGTRLCRTGQCLIVHCPPPLPLS